MLLLHVIIAVTSIMYSGYTFINPSRQKINNSWALVAATIATGTLLVVFMHADLVAACRTGLVYLGVVFTCLAFANRRLKVQNK